MEQNTLYKYRDIGLLILRVGVGFMFILHGYPKITGGTEGWIKLGHSMDNLGIHFLYSFWGFMASFAEFGGGILLMLGLFTRFTALLLFFNMFVAVLTHLTKGDGIMGASHALEVGILFISIFFIGPGKYSLDAIIQRKFKN